MSTIPGADMALRASGQAVGDPAVARAVAASNLAGLPADLCRELLADAARLRVPGGTPLRRAGDEGPYLLVVVNGLVRVFLVAPEGRTLTIRYCRAGALIGVVSLFRPGYVLAATAQALVESDVLVIRAAAAQRLAAANADVAHAFLLDLSERVVTFVAEIPGSVFATVRQRLARHLLDLASEAQRGPALVARVTQQDLADAVGTAREVVVRALRDLRDEGIVETGRDGITILEPSRLYAELFSAAAQPAREWAP